MKIDNFALQQFQTCPAKYDLRMRQGWVAKRRSGALGFGGAVHAGIAAWYKTKDVDAAILAIDAAYPEGISVDDFRTREKCVQVMIEYTRKYPAEQFTIVGAPDNPMIEVPFTLELGLCVPICNECGFNHGPTDSPMCVQCGAALEPIEYGGICDGLIEFSGIPYVFEHKSTTQLGSSYFNQFKPNNQVTGYIWAAGLLSGQDVNGALINAIGIYKASATKFERQITSRSKIGIEAWKYNVQAVCGQIKLAERSGVWSLTTGSCTQYGLCEYHSVHVLENPKEQIMRLDTDYIKEAWDYELREG